MIEEAKHILIIIYNIKTAMHTFDEIILQESERDVTFNSIALNHIVVEDEIGKKSPKRERIKIFDVRKKSDSFEINEIITQKKHEERYCQTEEQYTINVPFDKINKVVQKHEEISIQQQKKQQKKEFQDSEPKPFKWIEKRPYNRIITAYEQKIIKVPVQKVVPSEYQIQHIVEYIKKEVTEIKPELEKRQFVDMKLNYLPIDKLIIHIPQHCIENKDIQKIPEQNSPKIQNKIVYVNEAQNVAKVTGSQARQNRKIYLVSSDNYDFDLRSTKWDMIMNEIQNLKEKQKALYSFKGFN